MSAFVSFVRKLLVIATLLVSGVVQAADPLADAIAAYERRDYVTARRQLTTLSSQRSTAAVAQHYLGWIAFHSGQLEKAISHFAEAVSREPKNSSYHSALARAYGAAARTAGAFKQLSYGKKAKEELEVAIALDPSNPAAHWGMMEIYLHAPSIFGGSIDKAKLEAAEIARFDPLLGFRARGRIHAKEGRRDLEEHEYLEALRRRPADRDPYFWLGYHYQERKQFEKAFAVFERRVTAAPGDRGAWYEIGRTAAYSGQRLARGLEALQLFEQLPSLRRDEPPLAMLHLRRAQIFEKQGRLDLARQQLAAAKRLDPAHSEIVELAKRLSP
jgi:tetratricopeptide (TPR) repeat protein